MDRHLATLAALVLAASSCSSGDSATTVTTTPALSAKFDGTTWTATSVFATLATGGYLSVTASGPGIGTFTFALIANAPGAFSIGPASPVTTTYTLLSSTWSATTTNGSGSVTITSFTTNSASGTFNFLVPAVTTTAATGYKAISAGTFTVTF